MLIGVVTPRNQSQRHAPHHQPETQDFPHSLHDFGYTGAVDQDVEILELRRAVEDYEAGMVARATIAADGAAAGLNSALSSDGVDAVLDHYRERERVTA